MKLRDLALGLGLVLQQPGRPRQDGWTSGRWAQGQRPGPGRDAGTIYGIYVGRGEVRGKTSSSHSDLQCGELRHAGQNELVTLLCTSILCGELVS
jgi:hypothetical protein